MLITSQLAFCSASQFNKTKAVLNLHDKNIRLKLLASCLNTNGLDEYRVYVAAALLPNLSNASQLLAISQFVGSDLLSRQLTFFLQQLALVNACSLVKDAGTNMSSIIKNHFLFVKLSSTFTVTLEVNLKVNTLLLKLERRI